MSNGMGWGSSIAIQEKAERDETWETSHGSRRLAEQQAEYRDLGTLREVEVGGGRGSSVTTNRSRSRSRSRNRCAC